MSNSRWKEYVNNNYKEYLLVTILFLIGLFVGVLIINNYDEIKRTEISTYFNDFIIKFKEIESINKSDLIINSIKNHAILAIIIWISGTTVIGIPIVLVAILYRGITLGVTIATISYTLGIFKGILFCFISIFIQNIMFIPAILTLGVSSIKLYKSIIKDKRKENIKIEIIRHTIISILMLLVLILASIIENTVSLAILKNFIKYF